MITYETNLASFQDTLARYMRETSKTPDEVLEKKGRDLGIKLFQGFWAHKLGGDGARKTGLAKAQLAERTAAGEGTRVRASLVSEYLARRKEMRVAIASFIGPRSRRQQLKTITARVNLWRQFVGREIATRQGGIGVLAASFLWYRKRTSQANGRFFVMNKRQTRNLGFVEKGTGYLRIVGITDGLSAVDTRYGIVSGALSAATADMQLYIQDKFDKIFGRTAA